MQGRSTYLDDGRAKACSRCGWGLFGYTFSLAYHFFSFSPSLWNGWVDNLWNKTFSTDFS